jgi:hypothetical protein
VVDFAPLVVARWIQGIVGPPSVQALAQYITLWCRLQDVHLTNESDRFTWKWSANQQYSAAGACWAFFHGQCGIAGAMELSKVRAPPTCKLFILLALLGRSWTSERLQHHTTCRIMAPVHFALKPRSPCSTYFSTVLLVGKFGSGCLDLLVSDTSCPRQRCSRRYRLGAIIVAEVVCRRGAPSRCRSLLVAVVVAVVCRRGRHPGVVRSSLPSSPPRSQHKK